MKHLTSVRNAHGVTLLKRFEVIVEYIGFAGFVALSMVGCGKLPGGATQGPADAVTAPDPFPLAQGDAPKFKAEALSESDLASAVSLPQTAMFEGAARAACENLLGDALGKAGKSSEAASGLCDAP